MKRRQWTELDRYLADMASLTRTLQQEHPRAHLAELVRLAQGEYNRRLIQAGRAILEASRLPSRDRLSPQAPRPFFLRLWWRT